jgi:hypothetical protein
LFAGQLHYKYRTFTRNAVRCNAPPVAFDYPSAHGEPHACPFIAAGLGMQTLEGSKDFVYVELVKADPVIFNVYTVGITVTVAAYPTLNLCRLCISRHFDKA